MTRKGKARENRTKEGPRTRVRTSGRKNSTPGWPDLHGAGPRGGQNIKRGAKALGVSLPHAHTHSISLSLSFFSSGLLGGHTLTPQRCVFLLFSKYN